MSTPEHMNEQKALTGHRPEALNHEPLSSPAVRESALPVKTAKPDSDSAKASMNWPLKLRLMPLESPALQNAHVVLTADCAPAACAKFHNHYVAGARPLLLCPKLEPKEELVRRLTDFFTLTPPKSLEIVRMEVPCCCIPDLVRKAQEAAGTHVPVRTAVLSRTGQEHVAPLHREGPGCAQGEQR